jgi:hypothetical protein
MGIVGLQIQGLASRQPGIAEWCRHKQIVTCEPRAASGSISLREVGVDLRDEPA